MESAKKQQGALLTIIPEENMLVCDLLAENNIPEKGILVILNGNIVHDYNTLVKADDKILILPAVVGGKKIKNS